MATTRKQDRIQQIADNRQAVLDRAALAQIAYWDALRELELVTGVDLEDVGELTGLTVQDVIDSFGPDGLGGVEE